MEDYKLRDLRASHTLGWSCICVFIIMDKVKARIVGEEVKGVGFMKDEEIKLEEIESSHTLGGYRRCRYYSVVRYTLVNRSRRIC
jgi:hypothetical protein